MPVYKERAAGIYRSTYKGCTDTTFTDQETGEEEKGVYREAVLQLAAYGLAELIQMPQAERFVILHVTTDGVREIELNIGALEKVAWGACLDLHQWTETMKGKRL